MKVFVTFLTSVLLLFGTTSKVVAQQSDEDIKSSNAILDAVLDFKSGDILSAWTILTALTEQEPENDAAWYYLARCATESNDIEKTEECLKKAVDLDPKNFWYRHTLAILYVLTSRVDLGIEIYESLLHDFPKNTELYVELYDLYSNQEMFDKALAIVDEIETVKGVSELSTMSRYDALIGLGRNQDAKEVLLKYNQRYSSPSVLCQLANHYEEEDDALNALKCYAEALELEPEFSPAVFRRVDLYRRIAEYEKFLSALDDFVSMENVPVSAKVQYLQTIIEMCEPRFILDHQDMIDKVVESTVQAHPTDTSARKFAGKYYIYTDKNDKVKYHFHQNMKSHPDLPEVTTLYLQALWAIQDWEELVTESKAAYERFPEIYDFIHYAAIAYSSQGKHQEQIDVLKILLRDFSDNETVVADVWSSIGDAYSVMGENKKSFKAYEKTLKLDPNNLYVLNNYAYNLCLEGKSLKKAYNMSKKTVDEEPDSATYLDTLGWILYTMGKPDEARTHFKRAMLYGGKESAVILDHYAEVLFALGEYNIAMMYWNMAFKKNNGEIEDLEERVLLRKEQMKEKNEK